MKKRCTSILAFILILLITTTTYASNLNDAKKDLSNVNGDIKETKQEIDDLKGQQNKVREQLEVIEENLRLKEQELSSVEKQLSRCQTELDEVINKLQETEDELTAIQESLEILKLQLEEAINQANEQEKLNAERLRSMYMNSSTSYLEIIFEAKSFNDLIDRINMIKQMISYDQQMFDSMQLHRDKVGERKQACEGEEQKILECKKDIEENKVILEQKHQEIENTKKRITRQKNEIQDSQNEKESLLNQLSEEEIQAREELEQQEKESKELEKLIREIQKKRAAEEAARKAAEKAKNNNSSRGNGNKSANSKGNTWPVPSSTHISSSFGYRTHPITRQWKLHKGIDISGGVSSKPAVAMKDGVVILSQYFGSYGNCVIIDHGDGISTLYAHGWSTTVSVGKEVKQGDTVLKIGSTGSSTGPHLHFEVRKNGVPVNPLDYVSR